MRAEEFKRGGADLAVDRSAVDAFRVDTAFGELVLAFLVAFVGVVDLASPGSVSGTIAWAGHSGSHTPQSMHSSGWITSMFSPS
jgi:hypothetical protein